LDEIDEDKEMSSYEYMTEDFQEGLKESSRNV